LWGWQKKAQKLGGGRGETGDKSPSGRSGKRKKSRAQPQKKKKEKDSKEAINMTERS